MNQSKYLEENRQTILKSRILAVLLKFLSGTGSDKNEVSVTHPVHHMGPTFNRSLKNTSAKYVNNGTCLNPKCPRMNCIKLFKFYLEYNWIVVASF